MTETSTTTTSKPAPIEPGRYASYPGAMKTGDGRVLIPDGNGGFDAVELVKPQLLIEDEMVRKLMGFADDLSAQISRFRGHSFGDIGDFQALLADHYGARKGGKKGNVTFMTYDGLFKVTVQVAEQIHFGPELQTAKNLIDECLNEWSETSRPEIRTIVTRAFNVDKEGQVNRSELNRLRKWDIEDPRWKSAMEAIADAARPVGSKEYLRFYKRDRHDGSWTPVTIDLANA